MEKCNSFRWKKIWIMRNIPLYHSNQVWNLTNHVFGREFFTKHFIILKNNAKCILIKFSVYIRNFQHIWWIRATSSGFSIPNIVLLIVKRIINVGWKTNLCLTPSNVEIINEFLKFLLFNWEFSFFFLQFQ